MNNSKIETEKEEYGVHDVHRAIDALAVIEKCTKSELLVLARSDKFKMKKFSTLVKADLRRAVTTIAVNKGFKKEELIDILINDPKVSKKKWRPVKRKDVWKIIAVISLTLAFVSVGLTVFFQNRGSKDDEQLKVTMSNIETLVKKYLITNIEFKKKIKELESALGSEPSGNIKDREAAIKAFNDGDLSKAQGFFEKLSRKDKEREILHAKTRYNLGNVYFLQLEFDKALEAYLDAERLEPEKTEYLGSIGLVYLELAKYPKAEKYFKKALANDLKTQGAEHPKVAARLSNLGLAQHELGNYQKAVESFEKALAIDIKTSKDKPAEVATDYNNLGMAYFSLGEYKKAVEFYEKALVIDTEIYGDRHTEVAIVLNNLGAAQKALKQYKKAIENFERALEIDTLEYGNEHPDIAIDLNNLGLTSYAAGDFKKALDYYHRALPIFVKTYGEAHPQFAAAMNNLGLTKYAFGEYEEAVKCYEKALPVFINAYGENHPYVASCCCNMGEALKALEEYGKAESYYKKALRIFENKFGPGHPKTEKVKKGLREIQKK